MTTMTYGQLVEAYVAVREERDRLRADDLAIRQLLRDYGASVGGTDPLPAVVAETLDAARKTGAELVELRDRHEQVCQELAEARRGCERLRTERDRLRRRLGDVLDLEELPEDHTIVAAVRRLRAALGSTPDTGRTA